MRQADHKFVVATPARSVCDENARVLAQVNALRFIALGTRNGTAGVPPELTRLKPAIGAVSYGAGRVMPSGWHESFRMRLHPCFDRWVKKQLVPGDHMISSYGYTNACFKFVRAHGGKTFLDAGNSHPENFWALLVEEHRRWNWAGPPIPLHQHRRAIAMMEDVDYVLSPSSFVTRSFVERRFKSGQILSNVYPVDLSCFTPAHEARPKDRPLTVISTGQLSLRKGTPYLLEAFRLVRARHSTARLLLTQNIHDSVRPVLREYADLPIEWAPGLPHPQLAERLRSADVFVLPSIEEGLVRTAAEAMACGLPVVVTPHTGVNDLVIPGVTGEVVPIRDAKATAQAILSCFERLSTTGPPPVSDVHEKLSFTRFAQQFTRQLHLLGLLHDCRG